MIRSCRLPVGLCICLAWLSAPLSGQESLDKQLQPYLARYDLPALAAAVVVNGKVAAAGAVGTRRIGTEIPVTIDDRFHLGSDTKAMTALLAGMFVEAGKLRWDSTVGEVLPEVAKQKNSAIGDITLTQLLSHTSGIAGDNEELNKLLERALSQDGNLDEIRAWVVEQWAPQPLATKPGTTFAYANMNYVIAGAMLERLSGKTWEELITERVFKPLELSTAGLGPPATLGQLDAPLCHLLVDGKAKAFLTGPNGDNPPLLGPAGTAHMSILDFAKWAGWSAGQGKRGPKLVKPETIEKLHTPVIELPERKDALPGTPKRGSYALGFGQIEVPWAARPLLHHAGSNGKSLAGIWLELERDLGLVVCTNISGAKADEAMHAIAEELYSKYAK